MEQLKSSHASALLQVEEKHKLVLTRMQTEHAEAIRKLELRIQDYQVTLEEHQAEFEQYKAEIVIEHRGNVKLLQDHIERLSQQLQDKEYELAEEIESLRASYELKISSNASLTATWTEKQREYDALLLKKDQEVRQYKSQYDSISFKLVELQKIIEKEEKERELVIEARTHEFQVEIRRLKEQLAQPAAVDSSFVQVRQDLETNISTQTAYIADLEGKLYQQQR